MVTNKNKILSTFCHCFRDSNTCSLSHQMKLVKFVWQKQNKQNLFFRLKIWPLQIVDLETLSSYEWEISQFLFQQHPLGISSLLWFSKQNKSINLSFLNLFLHSEKKVPFFYFPKFVWISRSAATENKFFVIINYNFESNNNYIFYRCLLNTFSHTTETRNLSYL